MKTETISFRDFMDGSWKLPKRQSVAHLPAIAFTYNEPTVFLTTLFGVGVLVVVLESVLSDTNYAESIRSFRIRYLRYAYPICVVATGVYAFIKVTKILL